MNILLGVLTGGPLAGKTTVTERVTGEWSTKLVVAPEVATVLIESLMAPPQDPAELHNWLESFQKAVTPTQRGAERCQMLKAQAKGARVVLCDRGILDGAAYLPGGMEQFASLCQLDPEEELARYDFVIHLESVATANPPLWDALKGTNPARYETLEQAEERELALRKVYDRHPNYHFIPGGEGIESVVRAVQQVLSDLLDTEIERKWRLPHGVPAPLALETYRSVPVRQGYLTDTQSGAELRIRQIGDEYFITIKGGTGLSRKEWERTLPGVQFDALWPETEGRRIEKTRSFIPHGEHTVELDVFHGNQEGLVLFEVEFNSVQEASAYVPPAWARGCVEVTSDPLYKNKALAG